jgi:sn-glycerol 3-phosphate transport system substrate-binding protein
MAGKKAEEYKGVAKFFEFLSQTKVQAASHQRTGYLPVTMAAYDLTKSPASTPRTPAPTPP